MDICGSGSVDPSRVCRPALFQTWDPEEAPTSGRRRASLSDLKGVEDIEDLSVRQLKEILARNFVDYKGCCEKWELMERVTRLYQDQQNLLGESEPMGSPLSKGTEREVFDL